MTDNDIEALKTISKGPRDIVAKKEWALVSNLIVKAERARAKESIKKQVKLSVSDFLTMADLILGDRLKKQKSPTDAWFNQMQNRLNSRGVDREMAMAGLNSVRDTWPGDIWIDTLINSIDKVAAMDSRNTIKGKTGWLKQLKDDHTDQETE